MGTFREGVTAAFDAVYAGPIRAFFERLGLDPYVEGAYERLRDAAEWIDYRRAPDPYPLTVGPAAGQFHLRNRIEYNRVSTLVGEREVLADLLGRLRPDDVFWDVGANIGTHTCLAADVLSSGTVVAFEPHPDNFADLERNVALNGLGNVRTMNCGLGAASATETLNLTGEGAGYGTHSLVGIEDGVGTVAVQIERGDDLIAEGLPAPTVIKVDVQGAELSVFDGLGDALSREACRVVLCEVHPPHATVEEVAARLGEHGFETSPIAETGTGVFRSSVDFVLATREAPSDRE